MFVFDTKEDRVPGVETALGEAADFTGRSPARRIALGTVERCAVDGEQVERRFAVTLEGGRVYTVDLQAVPRGTRTLVSLFGPDGELIGCDGDWSRVRLVQSAPTSGAYAVSVEVGPGGEGFVLRVLSWSVDEVARAIEDPLYVL